MRRLPVLPALLCLGPLCASAGAETGDPAGTKAFGGWTATCNNLGACVALGATSDDALFYVRIARDAGADAAPQVRIVLATQDPLPGRAPAFTLTARGDKTTSLGPYPAATDGGDMTGFTAVLAPVSESLAFIDAARNAATLDYALLGTKGTLDLKGLSATLRWIDARQGRAGTPTALVAKGMTPVGQVPGPRDAPVVIAAPNGSVVEIAKPTLSKAVLAAAAAEPDCEQETVAAHDNAQAWRVDRDRILVAVPCLSGAYNFTSALFLTDGSGGAPRPVDLPQPPVGDAMAPNLVTNMAFDLATMILSDFAKGRGIGDCGGARTWIWTGQGFALLSAAAIDTCPGALQEDWPSTYVARRH